MLTAALFLAAQAAISDEWVDRAVQKARPAAECQVGPDCAAKWVRARRWVAENSRFAIARETDGLIITHGSGYTNTDPALAVVMDPPRGDVRTIRLRAWCGNWIRCFPSTKSLRRMFRQAMLDTTATP